MYAGIFTMPVNVPVASLTPLSKVVPSVVFTSVTMPFNGSFIEDRSLTVILTFLDVSKLKPSGEILLSFFAFPPTPKVSFLQELISKESNKNPAIEFLIFYCFSLLWLCNNRAFHY
jgi:hypothetical protein